MMPDRYVIRLMADDSLCLHLLRYDENTVLDFFNLVSGHVEVIPAKRGLSLVVNLWRDHMRLPSNKLATIMVRNENQKIRGNAVLCEEQAEGIRLGFSYKQARKIAVELEAKLHEDEPLQKQEVNDE